jgi:hypothetical protein
MDIGPFLRSSKILSRGIYFLFWVQENIPYMWKDLRLRAIAWPFCIGL